MRLILGTLSLVCLSSCASAGPVPAAVEPGAGASHEDIPAFRHPPVRLKQKNAEAAANQGGDRPKPDAATASDLKFLKNAQHAIDLYNEFIKRANGDESYTDAVTEARERITELEETMRFVEAGMRERAAK
jgi:hypothetical protein